MNRPSTLVLLVGCLALLSRGAPVAPSSALAQDKAQAEAAADEEPANAEPQAGGAVSDPHESPVDDDSDEDDSGNGGGNGEENDDDEAASGSPAVSSGPQSQGVEAL